MKKYPINREEFRTWLKCFPDNKVVGYANDSTKDPICRFLRTQLGVTGKFEITGTEIVFYKKHDYEAYQLPLWAQRFIDRIDSTGMTTKVTAAEARKAANR